MTQEEIYKRLKQHDEEWLRAFVELDRLYKDARPELKETVMDMLKRHKG